MPKNKGGGGKGGGGKPKPPPRVNPRGDYTGPTPGGMVNQGIPGTKSYGTTLYSGGVSNASTNSDVNSNRPVGWDQGYGEGGLPGGGAGGGSLSGGGGGGGAAGSNPLSGLGFAAEKITAQGGLEGTNVEEITQAQGAKKSKKQRKREATY